jgi:hypothetical protein
MLYSVKMEPRVSFGLGLRHYVTTLAACLLTSDSAKTVFYTLLHPDEAASHLYVSKGFAPSWLYFLLMVTSLLLGAFIWSESAASAARKSRARQAFIWVWPFYVITMIVRYVIAVQVAGSVNRLHDVFAYYVLGIAIIILIGSLVFLHFQSSSSNDLFFAQKAA